MPAPDAAANQSALYKQEPWGKPNQGNTGVHSCYKLGVAKKGREEENEWCLGGTKAAGENIGRLAQRSPWQGVLLNGAQEGKKSPGTEMTSLINITFGGVC